MTIRDVSPHIPPTTIFLGFFLLEIKYTQYRIEIARKYRAQRMMEGKSIISARKKSNNKKKANNFFPFNISEAKQEKNKRDSVCIRELHTDEKKEAKLFN